MIVLFVLPSPCSCLRISKLDLISLGIGQNTLHVFAGLKRREGGELQREMKQSSYANLQVSCGQQDISSPPTNT